VIEIPTTPYYLVLLESGDQYSQLNEYAMAHVDFIDKLITESKILIGGDLDVSNQDVGKRLGNIVGAYLLNVRSMAEAADIARNDPFIIHEVYTPLIIRWDLVDVEDEK
jgi:uncharacterized protein YciI